MDEDEIERILGYVVQELTKEENLWRLDQQRLATSIFFSFVQGVLNNKENNDEKIESIRYCVDYIKRNETSFKDF